MTPTIYYCYDAYCGWCYGFSPVIKQLSELYADRMAFEVLSGGMILPDTPRHIGAVAGYISEAYKVVEETTVYNLARIIYGIFLIRTRVTGSRIQKSRQLLYASSRNIFRTGRWSLLLISSMPFTLRVGTFAIMNPTGTFWKSTILMPLIFSSDSVAKIIRKKLIMNLHCVNNCR